MTAKRQPVTYPAARKPLNIEETTAMVPTAEAEAAEAGSAPPSRIGKKAVTFYLPREKWLALRTTSLRTGRPTHELMAEATDWLLSKYREAT